jgi:hypothetical protein
MLSTHADPTPTTNQMLARYPNQNLVPTPIPVQNQEPTPSTAPNQMLATYLSQMLVPCRHLLRPSHRRLAEHEI